MDLGLRCDLEQLGLHPVAQNVAISRHRAPLRRRPRSPRCTAHFLGSITAIGLLPAAPPDPSSNGTPARTTKAPTPVGPPTLVGGEAEIVDAQACISTRALPAGPARRRSAPGLRLSAAYDLGDGLQHAGLVVGNITGHQRRFLRAGEQAFEDSEIDDTVAIDRDDLARSASARCPCSTAEANTRRRPTP